MNDPAVLGIKWKRDRLTDLQSRLVDDMPQSTRCQPNSVNRRKTWTAWHISCENTNTKVMI